MKKYSIIIFVLIFSLLSGCAIPLQSMSSNESILEQQSVISQSSEIENYTTCEISPLDCEKVFGVTPEKFCRTNGENTVWYGRYISAEIDDAGNLVVVTSDTQIQKIIDEDPRMHILQLCIGNKDKIVTEIIPPTDPLYKSLYDNFEIGYTEISEDYTKIVADIRDLIFYSTIFMGACSKLQILSGVPAGEVRVELIVHRNNEILYELVYPDDTDVKIEISF